MSTGIYSSRQLARACEERVDVMAVAGLIRPDFRTVEDFRKRHLLALSDLFCRSFDCVYSGMWPWTAPK